MTGNVFITGISSGLGLGLTRTCLDKDWSVYGLSRRESPLEHTGLRHVSCDLGDAVGLAGRLETLLGGLDKLDLVILNAGVLGEIRDLTDTSMASIQHVMDINVWANKRILDWLHRAGLTVDQIVLISSGAAVNGNKGWGAYSLSKATLNMLAKLYAHEFPDTHFCALALGLVDTAMQDYLCDERQVDGARYPSVEKLRDARGTASMPTPELAARHIADAIPNLKRYPSGSFQDIRTFA